MKAVRFIAAGRPAEVVDLPEPRPGPGEVLLKIGGAGVCHSDLHVLEQGLGFEGPFTLGHENAGWVAELGDIGLPLQDTATRAATDRDTKAIRPVTVSLDVCVRCVICPTLTIWRFKPGDWTQDEPGASRSHCRQRG